MLRDRAGDKAFARGADYFRSEQVQILIIEAGRVLAQVAGSEDYRTELRNAGFESVEIVDSGADLNAYAKVEGQAGCCSPGMDSNDAQSCCSPATSQTLHQDLTALLSSYDVNSAASSVKVYALKPATKTCCGPECCNSTSI